MRRVLERGDQPPARIAVAAEQVLDAGGLRHDGEPLRGAVGGEQGEHVEQRLAALVQAAGVGEGLGHRAEQPRPALPVGVGEQLRAGAEPAGGGGGGAAGGGGGRLREERDGAQVAGTRALLDVEGADAGPRPAGGQRGRHALVRREPPRRGSGVVDGTAQERVAEAERAPVARGAEQVRGHEAVERGERVGRLQVGRRGCQLGVERVAGHGRAVEQRPRGGRQLGDLEPDGGEQRGGQGVARVAGDPGELLEVERVARGLAGEPLAQPGVGHVADQLERRGVGERGEGEDQRVAVGARGVEDAGSRLHGAQGEDEEVRRARRAAQQVQHELDRRLVGPVQVVEEERDGLLSAEHLQQGAERAVAAEALARADGGGPRALGRGGEDRGQVGAGRLDPAGVERRDVVVEGVDDEPEGHVALVLGGAAVEHQEAGLGGPPVHGAEQRALADTGLAEHGEDAAAAILDGVDGLCDRRELALPAQQTTRGFVHAAASSVIGGMAGPASSDSMVATRPSQPEKSVSLPSAAVTRPVRASSASRSSSARLMFRGSTDRSIGDRVPPAIEATPSRPPPTLGSGVLGGQAGSPSTRTSTRPGHGARRPAIGSASSSDGAS